MLTGTAAGFHLPLWFVAAILAAYALIYAGPVLLSIAVLLLLLPATRRQRGLRRAAYGLVAVDFGLLVVSAPVLPKVLGEYRDQSDFKARTHYLTAPQTLGGITFPPGSTVHLDKAGNPRSGTLPAPTPVLGLVLAGDFAAVVGADGGMKLLWGTLATPAVVQGVPCSAGPLQAAEDMSCILMRDHVIAGITFAAGEVVEVYVPAHGPSLPRLGTLAQSTLLFAVSWPAGTVVDARGGDGTGRPAELPPDGPGPKAGSFVKFNLPAGHTAALPGVVLHGPLNFTVIGDGRATAASYSVLPHQGDGRTGYVQVGGDRYARGERPGAGQSWKWDAPLAPGQP